MVEYDYHKLAVRVDETAGLHARPAALLSRIMLSINVDSYLAYDGKTVNAKSVIAIMSLGIGKGQTFELYIHRPTPEQTDEFPVLRSRIEDMDSLSVVSEGYGPSPLEHTTDSETVTTTPKADSIEPDAIFFAKEADDAYEAIGLVAGTLVDNGFITVEHAHTIIDREKTSPTGLAVTTPIALAHSGAPGVLKEGYALGVFEEPVTFRRMDDPKSTVPVQVVIVLAVSDRNRQTERLKTLIQRFTRGSLATELAASHNQAAVKHIVSKFRERQTD